MKKHFNSYPPAPKEYDSDRLIDHAEYIERELFSDRIVANVGQNLLVQLRDFVKTQEKMGAESYGEAITAVNNFAGFFALQLLDKDWVAQQNCLSADRIQVDLQIDESENNPLYMNIIVAGVAEKVPRILISDGLLSGGDRLLKLSDKIDIGSGTDEQKRAAYYREIVDSLWMVLYEEKAPRESTDLKEVTLLSEDHRSRLIGDYNIKFGGNSKRLVYLEIDQPMLNVGVPEMPRYLDDFLLELNTDIADDEQENNIKIPVLLYRCDKNAPQLKGLKKGVRSKISFLKEIIKIAEGK